jgi:hypothetical protein
MGASWLASNEAALISFLVAHKAEAEQVGPSTCCCCANLNIQLKETYVIVSLLKEQSGFKWDELSGASITIESKSVCKGTSVQSLTSPVPHYVYMYSLWSLYISDHICTTPTSSR